MRVLIADDHPATRKGIQFALEERGIEVCAEAATADAAVTEALRTEPDVCLIDIDMPGNGISAVARIAGERSDIACVILTASDQDSHLLAALKAGAAGYILKDTDVDRLPLALEAILKGEAVLPRSLVMRVAREFDNRKPRKLLFLKDRNAELTDREWEVLKLLREGLKTSEIAQRMDVSAVTVRSHVSAILRKLRVSGRDEAVRLLEEQP